MLRLNDWVTKTAQDNGVDPEVIKDKIRTGKQRPPQKKKGTKDHGKTYTIH